MAEVEGHGARITDEGIARIRARIGKGFEGRRPWRTEVTKDAAYHMALGIGDTSPLYHDEAYAKRTKWGGLLAPYIMIQTFDTLRSVGHSGLPEGLAGVHSIWTGSLFEWKRPLKVGDTVRADSYLKAVEERESKFGGGRSVYQTYEAVYFDQTGDKIGLRNDPWIRIERHKTAETKKYGATDLAKWTPEQVDDLMRQYGAETRTAERFWDDVKVGDELPKRVKGPLTPTAEIAFESQLGIYLVGNKVAANLYAKHPKLFIVNEQGVPEPPQRVHWDNHFTQNLLGLPGAYDLGLERAAWLCHLCTNWMGDSGHLRKISVQYRKFNYMGDVTWLSGRVLDARGEPMRNALVEIWQCDQNGVYLHSGGGDPQKRDGNFQGFGRFLTGSSGEYYFRTIKPVPYPGRTPHIHFAVKLKGAEKFTTQCYIKGHPGNAKDQVLKGVTDPKALATLMSDWRPSNNNSSQPAYLRIVLVKAFRISVPKRGATH
jgi:acyl dehydratase